MSPRQICAMDRLKKWWVLSGVEGVGPVKLKDWIESVGSLESAWNQAKRTDPSFAIKARQRLGSLALTLSEEGFWAMSWEDQAYPRPWRELRDAPVVVFGSGNQRAMNDRPFAAVVGTGLFATSCGIGVRSGPVFGGARLGCCQRTSAGSRCHGTSRGVLRRRLDGRLFGKSASTHLSTGASRIGE